MLNLADRTDAVPSPEPVPGLPTAEIGSALTDGKVDRVPAHTQAQSAPEDWLIVGLGKTGLAAARFLAARGEAFAVTDTRAEPPQRARLMEIPGAAQAWRGPLESLTVTNWPRVLVSPGVSPNLPFLCAARAAGAEVFGDIEWFARWAQAPILGITGSNGKTTVTALVGELLSAAGYTVAVGGNFGIPALDLLNPEVDLYVLELSSFQLETTCSLRAAGAAILNISPDHLDRHADMAAYVDAKARILTGAGRIVLNRADPFLSPWQNADGVVTVGLDTPVRSEDFGVADRDGIPWLLHGQHALLPAHALALRGRHQWLNVLAALALVWPWVANPADLWPVLRRFAGLPHRYQFVGCRGGVEYINDSKATNVGAVVAALHSVSGPLYLIAGGQGKGQDFAPLAAALPERTRGVFLLGQDALLMQQALVGRVPVEIVPTLEAAVQAAAARAEPGDTVLLSPAAASLDMFRDYAERGECFMAAVAGLPAC